MAAAAFASPKFCGEGNDNTEWSSFKTELDTYFVAADLNNESGARKNQLCKQLSLEVQSRDLKEKLWAEDSTLDQLIAKCQLHEQINATRDLIEVRSRDVNAFDRRTFKKKPDRGTFG
ncbi:hypothetical protein CAPTEDRAFT_210378 [Capitella teleta]|uniref:Uncharacterized protein n=1 Tax=Capitella teleta TaxID=283909 RepID=N1PBB2_CAPTE|nr:hypothetical protein CAPTEDRAFT_210378 [Capitella teleta]|eukprot:ELU18900.1 hypothetical protein CAPTEDRAFT_210378 [Capitella teleta]